MNNAYKIKFILIIWCVSILFFLSIGERYIPRTRDISDVLTTYIPRLEVYNVLIS